MIPTQSKPIQRKQSWLNSEMFTLFKIKKIRHIRRQSNVITQSVDDPSKSRMGEYIDRDPFQTAMETDLNAWARHAMMRNGFGDY